MKSKTDLYVSLLLEQNSLLSSPIPIYFLNEVFLVITDEVSFLVTRRISCFICQNYIKLESRKLFKISVAICLHLLFLAWLEISFLLTSGFLNHGVYCIER